MTIQAAGAVLYRRTEDGVEVALVHRPRYDDWSLPKGKLDPGETHLEAALREVHEETGYRGVPRGPLGEVRYRVARPEPADKVVRYWAVEATAGAFEPNGEVDALRWTGGAAALDALTYTRDRDVLARFLDAAPTASSA